VGVQKSEELMGAIQSLKNWWQAIASKDELDVWDGQPTPEEVKESASELKKMRATLDAWAQTTFSFLGKESADRISVRIRRAARSGDGEMGDFVTALRDGLVCDFFRSRKRAYAFLFEARYTESAEIVLGKVCSAYGIKEKFLHNEATDGAVPSKVLSKFKDWLFQHSFDLIIFDTGGDEYCGFLVPLASCQEVLSQLKRMEVRATNIPTEA
jgi:hypothetical protein